MNRLPDVALEAFQARAEAYLAIHGARPVSEYVGNIRTCIDAVHSGPVRLPVTVNHGETGNAWVCSPYTAYCTYAGEEAARMGHRLAMAPLQGLIGGLGRLLRRCRIDDAVVVNNWMLSTNCYPRLADIDMDRVLEEAVSRWPKHAIWLRSLNAVHHADWLQALERRGCVLIPSRQVYVYEGIGHLARRHGNLARDLKLLNRNAGFECSPLEDTDEAYRRAASLYEDLYIDKYSTSNPRYRHALLRDWRRAGLLRMHGLRDEQGQLQGVVGLFGLGNLVTAPVVGYNTALPQTSALYRRLMACVMHEAASSDHLINLSAGAAHFKRLRGGRPAIEYSAVRIDHLSARRRRAIRALGALARSIGVPIMKAWKL